MSPRDDGDCAPSLSPLNCGAAPWYHPKQTMGWWHRYLDLFDGEPTWLILFMSVLMLTGVVVIVEKLCKFSAWILAFSFVAAGFLFAVYFIFFW